MKSKLQVRHVLGEITDGARGSKVLAGENNANKVGQYYDDFIVNTLSTAPGFFQARNQKLVFNTNERENFINKKEKRSYSTLVLKGKNQHETRSQKSLVGLQYFDIETFDDKVFTKVEADEDLQVTLSS